MAVYAAESSIPWYLFCNLFIFFGGVGEEEWQGQRDWISHLAWPIIGQGLLSLGLKQRMCEIGILRWFNSFLLVGSRGPMLLQPLPMPWTLGSLTGPCVFLHWIVPPSTADSYCLFMGIWERSSTELLTWASAIFFSGVGKGDPKIEKGEQSGFSHRKENSVCTFLPHISGSSNARHIPFLKKWMLGIKRLWFTWGVWENVQTRIYDVPCSPSEHPVL